MIVKQRHKELETILVLVIACIVLYRVYHHLYYLTVAVCTGLLGLFIPAAARIIHFCWTKISEALGFVSSSVFLTIIFIFIVVPLGWITRQTGRSAIYNLKPGSKSYFRNRDHTYASSDLENLW